MKLKTQIVLVMVFVIAILSVGLALQQMRAIRISIAEEIETAGNIGSQMLSRVNEIYQVDGARPMQRFLTRLGRLRAHDITLLDRYGDVIYRTPAGTHLDTLNVPDWFNRTVSPETTEREFQLSNARLVVRTDGSRATREGWSEFRALLFAIAIGFVALSLFAWWLVGRAMRPFDKVNAALRSVGTGDYSVRLPDLPGGEATALGNSFNSMVNNLETSMAAREAEALAKAELKKNRELTSAMQKRIEQEHRSLAQELHDELGQHVTAIKSMAVSILRRDAESNPAIGQTSSQIVESADAIHAAIRQMVVHLRPASLDQFGLGDAIGDLVSDWRIKHPDKRFALSSENLPEQISPEIATATYRIAQEALTNAIRHSGANQIETRLRATSESLFLEIEDNGSGIELNTQHGFGISGMKERATTASGTLTIKPIESGGSCVSLTLPIGTRNDGQNQ